MDYEQSRFNMVEQQIRPWEVLNTAVLDLLYQVKREEFVPPAQAQLAFVDTELPIGYGASMLQPKFEARALQELMVSRGDKVLEIGTGVGYMTALLARCAHQVYSVEIVPALAEVARASLLRHGIGNATVEVGDGSRGWAAHAPYDVIFVGGSLPVLPAELKQQLAVGGRLFAVVGDAPAMSARLITRTSEEGFAEITLFETVLTPLQHAAQPARFHF